MHHHIAHCSNFGKCRKNIPQISSCNEATRTHGNTGPSTPHSLHAFPSCVSEYSVGACGRAPHHLIRRALHRALQHLEHPRKQDWPRCPTCATRSAARMCPTATGSRVEAHGTTRPATTAVPTGMRRGRTPVRLQLLWRRMAVVCALQNGTARLESALLPSQHRVPRQRTPTQRTSTSVNMCWRIVEQQHVL